MSVMAKVTSKGQITIPVEVRRALGVRTGDFLVFEPRTDYVIVRRQISIREASDMARAITSSRAPAYESDDEAILSALEGSKTEQLSLQPLEIKVAREDLA